MACKDRINNKTEYTEEEKAFIKQCEENKNDKPSPPDMVSQSRPVEENNTSPVEFKKIPSYILAADSSSLLPKHKSEFLQWHTDNFGRNQPIESVEKLNVKVYAVEDVSNLAKLESIEQVRVQKACVGSCAKAVMDNVKACVGMRAKAVMDLM